MSTQIAHASAGCKDVVFFYFPANTTSYDIVPHKYYVCTMEIKNIIANQDKKIYCFSIALYSDLL